MKNGVIRAFIGAGQSGKTKKCIDVFNYYSDEFSPCRNDAGIYHSDIIGKPFVMDGSGRMAPSMPATTLLEIAADAAKLGLKIVLIDDVHLFPDRDAAYILEGMALAGMEVYLFGRDVTPNNITSGMMGDILPHADEVTKLKAKCACGADARVSGDQSLCRKCFFESKHTTSSQYDGIPAEAMVSLQYFLGTDERTFPITFMTTKLALGQVGYTLEQVLRITDAEEILALLQKLGG